MLNPAMSEFIWCTSPRRVHRIDRSDFVLKDGTVAVSTVVRNLGAFFDESMSMTDHVNRLVRSCFYQLRRIKSMWRSLPTSTAIQLVNSFVVSRIDYCNSSLAGLPKYQLDRIHLYSTLLPGSFMSVDIMSTLLRCWETDFTGCVCLSELNSSVACLCVRHYTG